MHKRNSHKDIPSRRPRRWVTLLASHLLVVGLTMAGTTWLIREGIAREIAHGIRNNCLVTASIVRAQFRRAGIPSRTLVVDYDVGGHPLRHVAVVSALEDGSLAAFEEEGGSIPLGFVDWDPAAVAERLPADPLARVVRAAWAETLNYRDLAWKPVVAPGPASRTREGSPFSLVLREGDFGSPSAFPP